MAILSSDIIKFLLNLEMGYKTNVLQEMQSQRLSLFSDPYHLADEGAFHLRLNVQPNVLIKIDMVEGR